MPLLGFVLNGVLGTPVGEVPEMDTELALRMTSPPLPVAARCVLLAIWPPRVSISEPTATEMSPARAVPIALALMNPLSTVRMEAEMLSCPTGCESACVEIPLPFEIAIAPLTLTETLPP